MIPIVFGTVRISGNVIWSLPIQEVATTTQVSSGGKGGGGVSITEIYELAMYIMARKRCSTLMGGLMPWRLA